MRNEAMRSFLNAGCLDLGPVSDLRPCKYGERMAWRAIEIDLSRHCGGRVKSRGYHVDCV